MSSRRMKQTIGQAASARDSAWDYDAIGTSLPDCRRKAVRNIDVAEILKPMDMVSRLEWIPNHSPARRLPAEVPLAVPPLHRGGGRFAEAFAAMPAEYSRLWSCKEPEGGRGKTPRSRNKVKYTCLGCATNVWGKPGLSIASGDCDGPFEEEGGTSHHRPGRPRGWGIYPFRYTLKT